MAMNDEELDDQTRQQMLTEFENEQQVGSSTRARPCAPEAGREHSPT